MRVVNITFAEAREFVRNFHRHNKPPVGHVFSIGASDGVQLVGVSICGRPVSRVLDDGATLEVIRHCTSPNAPKGCASFLYSHSWRAARALGWAKLITYTLQSESGASLRGAGWRLIGTLPARDEAAWKSRPGRAWQSVVGQAKFRWEVA